MSVISVTDGLSPLVRRLFEMGQQIKVGADLSPAYNLTGMLYGSSSGFLMLSVPNALVRGVFSAMDEPGIELPSGPSGEPFEAHVTVMRPEELEMVGGIAKITERGKRFRYRLGGLVTTEPERGEYSRAWMLRVHSPELQALRRTYGLSSLPNNGNYDFHVTVATRKRGVLGRNEKRKASATG